MKGGAKNGETKANYRRKIRHDFKSSVNKPRSSSNTSRTNESNGSKIGRKARSKVRQKIHRIQKRLMHVFRRLTSRIRR